MRYLPVTRKETHLTVNIPAEESRRLRHKELLYSKHWYQLPLRELEQGVISTLIDKGRYYTIDDYRDQLQLLSEDNQIERYNNLLKGFLSNIYLVEQGKIFEPYLHPINFVYSAANGRVLTFYRYDRDLASVDGEYLYNLYKFIAFMLSKADINDYKRLSIADMEVTMSEHLYQYFRDLIKDGTTEAMLERLGGNELEILTTYASIVPNSRPATVKETRFLATWVSKRPKKAPVEEVEEMASDGNSETEQLELDNLPEDMYVDLKNVSVKSRQPIRVNKSSKQSKSNRLKPARTKQTERNEGKTYQPEKEVPRKKSRNKRKQNKDIDKYNLTDEEIFGTNRNKVVREPDMNYYGDKKPRSNVMPLVFVVLFFILMGLLYLYLTL